MTKDNLATVSQVTSLLMFISLFIAVIAYAFWPGNKGRFDEAQARALELNDKSEDAGNVQ
ncbi:MAG: cbb3-type cytochrome c oxidase subunit 3 [Pseudomonadota bacterium]